MSKTRKNGDMIAVAYDVLTLDPVPSTNPKHAGKFSMRCIGTSPECDEVNPKNNFFFTDPQLTRMAGALGLPDWTSLPMAIAAGDAKLHVTAKFCAAGETDLEDPTVVYGENDWYRVENTTVELGEEGMDFVREIIKTVAVESAKTSRSEAKKYAAAERIKRLLSRQGGVVRPTQDENVDDTADDDAELELAPAKGNKK